jgi:glycosyltransferase involved in cell wall biosynthesis
MTAKHKADWVDRFLLDISVVICIYTEKRWDDFLLAIDSVRRQSISAREIIVIVDHNPRLLERVRAHVTGVFVAENSELRGLSGARNSGIRAAGGAVVAFLDDDAVAAPRWLEELQAGYQDPAVIGVGGAIKPMWVDGRPLWFPEEFNWVVGCTYRGMPSTATPVRNFLGCNMSFRREVFQTIGNFRNGMGRVGTRPLGCEETELCIRAIQYRPNNVLLFKPSARVYHRVPANRVRWRYFLSRCYSEGLSKAQVARFVGSKDGLASERKYTRKTLPRGVLNGLKNTLANRDSAGLKRTGAIIAGLALTISGYLVGSVSARSATIERWLMKRAEVSGN